jgi:hypothetical protein
VENRHDPEAMSMQQAMNPDLVLAALDADIQSDKRP